MRQALGTTVFSGMLGVTVVGLFLTPVFYVVLRGFVVHSQVLSGGVEPIKPSSPLENSSFNNDANSE